MTETSPHDRLPPATSPGRLGKAGKVFIIAVREYRAIVATKAFLLALTIMPILMFGGIFLQRSLDRRVGPAEKRIVIFDGTGVLFEQLAAAAQNRNQHEIIDQASGQQRQPRYVLEKGSSPEPGEEERLELSERIRQGRLHAFVEIPAGVLTVPDGAPAARVAYYAENAAIAEEKNWIAGRLSDLVRRRRLEAMGVDPQVVDRAGTPVIIEPLGLVSRSNTGGITKAAQSSLETSIFLPFGAMMLMFMVIFLAAQPMLESVLEEKSQRIAEVLLGSANAFELMIGKLLGGVAGSLTVVAVYGCGAYGLAAYHGVTDLVPLGLLPWFLVYQVMAVLLFGSVFMAVGAAVNQLKEAQSMLLPVWLVMMFPLFIWFPVLREPNGSFATWASLIPPGTPMMMVLRMSASASIPVWQPVLGIVTTLAATILCVFVASRIFRIGILAQGKLPKPSELARWAIYG